MKPRATPLLLGLIMAAAALGVVVLAAALWLESYFMTNPRGYAQPDPKTFAFLETPKSEAGLDYRDLALTTAGGATLRGWLVPAAGDAKDVAVIAIHGRGGDRRSSLPLAPVFHEAGAAVALIDLRENGLSDGAGRGTGIAVREAEDAVAAAVEMRRLGYRKVVAFGCSLGASAAILAAARDPTIDGVVAEATLGSFESFMADIAAARLARFGVTARWPAEAWGEAVVAVTRLRLRLRGYDQPFDAVARIAPRPILLVHGARDGLALPVHARTLAQRAGANATLLILPNAQHCDGMSADGAAYRAGVDQFLEKIRAR
jgi:pimeloyl-ACP methyl ester carboxylesterase